MINALKYQMKRFTEYCIGYAGELITIVNAGSEAFQKFPVMTESLGQFTVFTSEIGASIATTTGLVISGTSLIAMYKLYDDSVTKVTSKIIVHTVGDKKEATDAAVDNPESKPAKLKHSFSILGQIIGTLGSFSNAALSAYNGWLMGIVFHLPIDMLIIIMGLLAGCGFFGTFALGRPPVVACFEDFATMLTEGSPYFSFQHKRHLAWTIFVISIALIGAVAAGLFVALATQTIALQMIGPHLMLPPALVTSLMAIFGTSTGITTAALMGRAVHSEGINIGLILKGKQSLGFAELTISQKIRSVLAGLLAVALSIGTAFGGFFGAQSLLLHSFHLAVGIAYPLAGVMALAFGILSLGLVARPLQYELVHKTGKWDGYTRDQKILSVLLNITGVIYRIAPALVIFVLPMIGIPVVWPIIVGAFAASFALMLFVKYIEKKCLPANAKAAATDTTPTQASNETDEHGSDNADENHNANAPVTETLLNNEAVAKADETTYGRVSHLIKPPDAMEYTAIRTDLTMPVVDANAIAPATTEHPSIVGWSKERSDSEVTSAPPLERDENHFKIY